jgi:hypothetical protein
LFIISPPGVHHLKKTFNYGRLALVTAGAGTLARIGGLVRERFGVDYTLAGLDVLLHRIGWSVQVPARRAGSPAWDGP